LTAVCATIAQPTASELEGFDRIVIATCAAYRAGASPVVHTVLRSGLAR
jgi:hypothetical protein